MIPVWVDTSSLRDNLTYLARQLEAENSQAHRQLTSVSSISPTPSIPPAASQAQQANQKSTTAGKKRTNRDRKVQKGPTERVMLNQFPQFFTNDSQDATKNMTDNCSDDKKNLGDK